MLYNQLTVVNEKRKKLNNAVIHTDVARRKQTSQIEIREPV